MDEEMSNGSAMVIVIIAAVFSGAFVATMAALMFHWC